LFLTPTSIRCQILHADGPRPSFEVATIKPVEGAPPPSPGGPPPLPRDELRTFITARMLIALAYNVPALTRDEIVGGPGWLDSQIYEIDAKINGPLSDAMERMSTAERKQKIQLMQQSLLADRFRLKVHFETRQLSQFALITAKGGRKLASAANPSGPHDRSMQQRKDPEVELRAKTISMEDLTTLLQLEQEIGGRPIANQTGLTGLYDVTLDWLPARVADANPDVTGPSLFTALEEQLGLKLVETKGPVEVVVVVPHREAYGELESGLSPFCSAAPESQYFSFTPSP